MIKGVTLHLLKIINIPNGNVLHALKSTDEDYFGFGEAYFSQIKRGAIKGWKKHNRFAINIIVPVGEIKFVIYDDRVGSNTFGQFEELVLGEKNYKRLTVSPGLWMAFKGLGKGISMLMDIIPEPHNPTEASQKKIEEINFIF